MAPINIDVSQATPQLELPSPVRASSKADSPSFDTHLQRASEQRPSSSTPATSTSSDSQRNRQDSTPQSAPASNASNSSDSSSPVKSDTKNSQPEETGEARVSDEAQSADVTDDKPSDAEDETASKHVATDFTSVQPPVVAIVEAVSPVPVAVAGCEQEQTTGETPTANVKTDTDNPTPSKPAGHNAINKAILSPVPVKPTSQGDVQAIEVSPVENVTVVTGENAVPKAVNESGKADLSEPSEEGSDAAKPETPKISSMHRYDVRQPATTHELAQEVHPDDQAASESGEIVEKATASKPTGRRNERNKAVASDNDEKPQNSDAESTPTNAAPTATPAQVAAAVADPLPQSGDATSQPANDTSVAPAVADIATPATSQTPDAPATRPLPAEPVASTNRATSGQHQVEHRHNSELSESDRARFVQRVTKAFQTASERGGPLKLRLSPPELGSVRMEVSLKDGALSARLEAETPAARAALLENLPALRERLAEQNVRIEKFEVDLQDQTAGGPGNGSTSDADTDRNPRSPHWRGLRRERESAAIAPAPVPVSTSGLDQLNVVI